MNRPEELIKKIYEEQGQINDVFFTACGEIGRAHV